MNYMIRQGDFHRAEPFRQGAGQVDIRPAGQRAVVALLFDGEPMAVPSEERIHRTAPVMIGAQPMERAPLIVEDEQMQGSGVAHGCEDALAVRAR